MNKVMGIGIAERLIYGCVTFLVVRYGGRFGLTTEDAAWIAGGGITLVGGVRAWLINRPQKLLTDAAAQLPENAKLVITTDNNASRAERTEAHALANASSDKVVAKTA